MEIKRLAKPCNSLIDLRNYNTSSQIHIFDVLHEGRNHRLDKISHEYFNDVLSQYNNVYTFGVYESVIEFFKRQKNKIKQDQVKQRVSIVPLEFTSAYSRKEERMNLAVKVSICNLSKDYTNELETLTAKELKSHVLGNSKHKINTSEAITIDISQNGLKIKSEYPINKTNLLSLRFTGIEKDFLFAQKYVIYKVISEEKNNEQYIYRLLKVDLLELHQEFDDFIVRMIHSHKRRYKVSLENTVASVMNKGYEQYFISRNSAINVFSEEQGGFNYIALSESGKFQYNLFNYQNINALTSLISKDNILKYAQEETKKELFWAVYIKESKGVKSFYSKVIGTSDLDKAFIKLIKENNGHIFKVSITPIKKTDAKVESSIENFMRDDISVNLMQSEKLNQAISTLKYLINIYEVPSFSYSHESDFSLTKEHITSIEKTLKLSNINQFDERLIRLETRDFRSEDRFSYETPITIRIGKTIIKGNTLDVSTKGFSAELSDRILLKENQKILVTFNSYINNKYEIPVEELPCTSLSLEGRRIRVKQPRQTVLV